MQRNDLIPFNLEDAKAGAPLVYRNGMEGYLVAIDPEAVPSMQLITRTKKGFIRTSGVDGLHWSDLNLDVFMAPKPLVFFKLIYPSGDFSYKFSTLEHALRAANKVPFSLPSSVCKFTILNGEVIASETVHRYNKKEALTNG